MPICPICSIYPRFPVCPICRVCLICPIILTYPTLTYIYPMFTSNFRDHFLDLSSPSLSYLITSFQMQFYPIHPIQSCPILSYRISSRLPTYLPIYLSMLTDTEIGMALYLLTGLPPFLRVKELRAGNRGELSLGGSGWAVEPLKPEEMVNQKVDSSNSF